MKSINQTFTVLSRDAMKKIHGGMDFNCNYVGTDGKSHPIIIAGDNINQAQANADVLAYSNDFTNDFPTGIDCPGSE